MFTTFGAAENIIFWRISHSDGINIEKMDFFCSHISIIETFKCVFLYQIWDCVCLEGEALINFWLINLNMPGSKLAPRIKSHQQGTLAREIKFAVDGQGPHK